MNLEAIADASGATDFSDRVADNTYTLPRGIRLRIRRIKEADGSLFLVIDPLPNPPLWAVREAGLSMLYNSIGAVMDTEDTSMWTIEQEPGGLIAHVSEEGAARLIWLVDRVLTDPACTSVFGEADPTLNPIPFHPTEGAPIRTGLTPLEAE